MKLSPRALLLVWCLLLPAVPALLPAQSGELPPLIDRELFFGDPEISGSQLSPDGRWISFIKPYRGARNVHVKKFGEAFEQARPITADQRPVPAYCWSQDSRLILYVQDKGGDENFHIYAVDPSAAAEDETGVPPARDLTPLDGIRAFIYSVPKKSPGSIIVGINDRDPAYHDVYRVDLDSGERELLIRNDQKVGGYVYDLEGEVRMALRQLADGGTELLRVDDDQLLPVYTCSRLESCFPVQFHPDGKKVYVDTNKGDADLSRLVLLDPATGEEELVESDPEGEVDFGGALFSAADDQLIGTFYVGDRVRIYPRDEQLAKDLEVLRKQLPEGEPRLQSSTRDMRYHLVSVTRDVDPGSLYLYDRDTGKAELLYRSRPSLPSEHLATMKAIRYPARDGLEIPAYLTLPRGVEPRGLPTIIHPHGGPWARDTWGYDSYAQFLANRGYAVLQPNFRGSTGYGKKFLNAGNREWGSGAMQHDITDGVRYLVAEGIADPQRVGIFGGSYGGYATLAGVTFTPDLFRAAVPYVAPSNLITLIESFPAYWGPFIKIWHQRVGDPSDPEDRADLIARSPLFLAEKIETPLLVVHGLNDPRVKKSESDQIVVALRESGLPIEYLVAPDEGHGFRSPENRMALAVALERFLAKHLGGRAQQEVPAPIAERLTAITVDVDGVELADQTLASYAETAPLPAVRADRVAAGTARYDVHVITPGGRFQGTLERVLEKGERNGAKVWVLKSTSKLPTGEGRDTYWLDPATLLPLARSAKQGQASIEMNFSPESVRGAMSMGGRELPIDVKLPAPVLGDSGAFEVYLAALPLEPGYETTLRVFELTSQKVRRLGLSVSEETIEIGSQSHDVYEVKLVPLDGQPGGGSYWISTGSPRVVLRSESPLPVAMGGGSMVVEATETEFAAATQ